MAKKSNTVVVKQQGKMQMYRDNEKLYFQVHYGLKYLKHGGKCIMIDNQQPHFNAKFKDRCFSTAAEAKRMFMNDFTSASTYGVKYKG